MNSHDPTKKRIAAKFGRAVEAYESGAGVQLEIVRRIAGKMGGAVGEGELWCDFGSGSGMLLERLPKMPRGARFACLDLSFAPLRRALRSGRTGLAVNADIDFMPIRPQTLDGASACSMLQWSASPENALINIAAALKPSGQFFFSVFVDGAFSELIETRARMGLPATVWLPTVSELLMALDCAGFEVSVDGIENFYRVLNFPDALAALGSLSSIGVTATGGRLLSRKELDELCRNYTVMFTKNGTVPLTYRAVIGKVRKKTMP